MALQPIYLSLIGNDTILVISELYVIIHTRALFGLSHSENLEEYHVTSSLLESPRRYRRRGTVSCRVVDPVGHEI